MAYVLTEHDNVGLEKAVTNAVKAGYLGASTPIINRAKKLIAMGSNASLAQKRLAVLFPDASKEVIASAVMSVASDPPNYQQAEVYVRDALDMGVLPREIVKVLAQGGIPYAHANDMVNRISAEGQTSAPDFTPEYVSEEDWREGESDGTDLNPYGVPLSSSVPSFGSPFHKAPVVSSHGTTVSDLKQKLDRSKTLYQLALEDRNLPEADRMSAMMREIEAELKNHPGYSPNSPARKEWQKGDRVRTSFGDGVFLSPDGAGASLVQIDGKDKPIRLPDLHLKEVLSSAVTSAGLSVPFSEASGKALLQYKVTEDINGKPIVASSIYVRAGNGYQLKRK